MIIISAPITIIPTLTFSLFSKVIIISWVGIEYNESVNLAIFFSLTFLFGFITYPTDMFLLAKEKIKYLYISAIILPLIFWTGILLTISDIGLLSFGIFKVIATHLLFLHTHLIKSLDISLFFFF